MKFSIIRGLLTALLLSGAMLGTASAAKLAVSLQNPAALAGKPSADGRLHYSISNTTADSIFVLKWQTPLFGIDHDLFDVSLGGQPAAYTGRLVKRGNPKAEDYLEIAPGETLSADVDLSASYDMRKNGQYAVQYAMQLDHVLQEDSHQDRMQSSASKLRSIDTLELRSETLYLWVEGVADVTSAPEPQSLVGGAPPFALLSTPTFVGCSNTRTTQLSTALTSARSYAANSNTYLNAGTHGARYTTWFGAYLASRYTTVKSHYTAIADALNNKPMKFNCGCTEADTYAYVYANQPYQVYLCGAFWSAPNTGTDSRAGTLIHETSHFTVVAGTQDYVYGQSGAKSLAISNPARAIKNADSHEYFAENNPAKN